MRQQASGNRQQEECSLTPHASRLFSVVTRSELETRSRGRQLGKLLTGGEIVGLSGELGSGKTCFVRGMAEGLEVGKEAWIRSPTFTLINEYHGRLPLYHIDLYRIEEPRALAELNLPDYFFSDGVSAVEWFEHLPAGEVDDHLHVAFAHVSVNRRRLTFTAHGERYELLVKQLARGSRMEDGGSRITNRGGERGERD